MNDNCKKCRGSYEIDESFFAKIKIPHPTLCPDCRQIRRMMFRNDRVFYNRKCDLSGKQFVSIYKPDAPYKIYHPDEWYSDKWNAFDYGRDYDFNRSFFEQFADLMALVPRLGIDIVNCENSYYCNFCGDDKNCYLDIAGEANEDCYFNLFVKHSRNVVDCTFVYNSELCYECINCYDCYNCQNSTYLNNCSDCFYCFDLIGCKNCLFSNGLRNKEYYIFNKAYSKDDYEKYIADLQMDSYVQRQKLAQGWAKFKRENAVHRANYFLNCENVGGDDLKNCKNTFNSFNVSNSEDCAYLYDVLDAKDCQDLNYSLYKPELSYELISTLSMVKSAFSMSSHYNNEVFYCDMVNNSSYLFGCIGLNHGKYCILNKQYSREEYEEMVSRIVEKMKVDGEWGEFFPAELSPFKYEETVANEYYPQEGVELSSKPVYQGPEFNISDKISEVQPDIVKQILICEKSGKPYRLIEEEIKFYQRMKIPVPRISPDQRHKDRLVLRNPRQLSVRKCGKCEMKMHTTYSSDRPEKVYCESCYQKEIY